MRNLQKDLQLRVFSGIIEIFGKLTSVKHFENSMPEEHIF